MCQQNTHQCKRTYPTCTQASWPEGMFKGSMSTSVPQVALSSSVVWNVYTPTDCVRTSRLQLNNQLCSYHKWKKKNFVFKSNTKWLTPKDVQECTSHLATPDEGHSKEKKQNKLKYVSKIIVSMQSAKQPSQPRIPPKVKRSAKKRQEAEKDWARNSLSFYHLTKKTVN